MAKTNSLNKYETIKKEIEKSNYRKRLLLKAFSCFKWDGVPDFDSRQLNMNALIMGATGMIKHPELGYVTIIGRDGSTPNVLGYGNKLIGTDVSGTIKVNGDAYWNSKISDKDNCTGVILFNDSIGTGILDIVNRYAEALEIADTSINIAMKNTRLTAIIPAATKNAKDQIDIAIESMYDGVPKAFYDPMSAGAFTENPLQELLNTIRTTTNIQDLIEMRADIYSRFCIEIGIPVVNNTKRSQLISGEIGGINTLSLVNLKDMLERRQEFCKRFNELYDENLTVSIAEEYLIESADGTSIESADGTADKSAEEPAEPKQENEEKGDE